VRGDLHMKTLFTLAMFVSVVMSAGCASKHAYQQPVPLVNQCRPNGDVCDWLGPHEWAQLTPAGCVLHTLVTGGHIAWECRKPKNGKTPRGGRWVWKKEKKQ
jgi:hypothetical protein